MPCFRAIWSQKACKLEYLRARVRRTPQGLHRRSHTREQPKDELHRQPRSFDHGLPHHYLWVQRDSFEQLFIRHGIHSILIVQQRAEPQPRLEDGSAASGQHLAVSRVLSSLGRRGRVDRKICLTVRPRAPRYWGAIRQFDSTQESVRGDDTGDVGHEFPAKLLTLYREPPQIGILSFTARRQPLIFPILNSQRLIRISLLR